MTVINIAGKPHQINQIMRNDVFELQNGNIMIVTDIYEDGTYNNIIIDPEDMTCVYGKGDFTNSIQNNNIYRKMEDR